MNHPTLRPATAAAYSMTRNRDLEARIAHLERMVVAQMATIYKLTEALAIAQRPDDDGDAAADPVPVPPTTPPPADGAASPFTYVFTAPTRRRTIATGKVTPTHTTLRYVDANGTVITEHDERTADERIGAARQVIQRTARGETIPDLWNRAAWEQERDDFQLARNTYMEVTYGT